MKPGTKETSFWEALEKFPPYRVRLVAKTGRRHLSDAEIAIASGIDITRVRELVRLPNYLAFTVAEMHRYFAGCNFDPTLPSDRKRIAFYEHQCQKRQQIPYHDLRKSPKWESEILPLLKIVWVRTNTSASQSSAA